MKIREEEIERVVRVSKRTMKVYVRTCEILYQCRVNRAYTKEKAIKLPKHYSKKKWKIANYQIWSGTPNTFGLLELVR